MQIHANKMYYTHCDTHKVGKNYRGNGGNLSH